MSATCTLFGACSCASCQATAASTPLSTANRPGLSSLRYRTGTFATFRQAMLDFITLHPVSNPDPADPASTYTLTSRSPDDYGVAMLELWAYVCDVLTFYQQSIANEGYLRTAAQPGSVARIAALLGYRPAPAVAASVYLAFLAAKNSTGAIPAGLQTQSDPPPGQDPVIFEVGAPIVATAADNQPVLLGPKISLLLNRSGLLIADDQQTPLAKGARLLFVNTAQNFLSEQQVDSVTPAPSGKSVTWRGDLGGLAPGSFHVYRLGRTFRCFGANAPATFYQLTTDSSGNPVFTSVPTLFGLPHAVNSTNALSLDAVYTGLGAGANVAIEYQTPQKIVIQDAIASVSNGSSTVGPLSGSTTQITLASKTIPEGADRRLITIYELLGPPLVFAATSFDSSASAAYPSGSQSINLLDASGIEKGSGLILASTDPVAGVLGDVVNVWGQPVPISQNGVVLGYSVGFTPALSASHKVSNTSVYANVTAATQGKTQKPEILGSGDASRQWQEFPLQNKPVTYVSNATAERGAASTLAVFVNDIEWFEVDTFNGHSPSDRIFVTHTGDDGTVYVRFGDGVTGQRLPTGNRNVMARYRAGAGGNGNVAPNSITQILQTVPGIQSVVNPLPAFGGADGESVERTRENAPVSVLTLGRAVSLRDYEALALTFHGIAKARASWSDLADRRGVSLTAATAGGQPLGELAQPLRDFLDQHRDPNVPLSITSVTRVPFVFRARLHLQNAYLQSAVKAAAEVALGIAGVSGLLSEAQLQIGESIFQSKLIAILQDIAGVDWVELVEFSTATASNGVGFHDPLLTHLHFSSKKLLPKAQAKLEVVYVSPQQIAFPSLTGLDGNPSVELTYTGGVNDL